MKKTIYLTLLLVIGFLILPNTSGATHAVGSDLTYQCLSANSYEVTWKFYRDCSGISAPNDVTLNITSANCTNTTATLSLFTVTELPTACQGALTTCQGGTVPGIEEYVYKSIITTPNCNSITISIDLCCRNNSITTINNPGGFNLYVEAFIDNSICNSSPVFTNTPVAYLCQGQNFTFNHGAVDPNGDSLVYSLVPPRSASLTAIPYLPGYSPTNPLQSSTPFSINPSTGDLNMTPTAIETTILAVQVSEYRNGTLIGTIVRDLQLIVTSCSNTLPTLSGVNGSNDFFVETCANEQICFDIFPSDPDSQNVTLNWNSGIAGGLFVVNPGTPFPSATFCWTPTNFDDTGIFTVTVSDDACPIQGSQTYSYEVIVSKPEFNIITTDALCAQTGSAEVIPSIPGSLYTYQWSNGETSPFVSLNVGTYNLTVQDQNGCYAIESVVINGGNSVITVVDSIGEASCEGGDGYIDLYVTGTNPPFSFNWANGETTQNLQGLNTGTYMVEITDSQGCSQQFTYLVGGGGGLTTSYTIIPSGCTNSGGIDLTVSGGSPPYTFQWSTGDSTEDLTGVNPGLYFVSITDANGCVGYECPIVSGGIPLQVNSTVTDASCNGGDGLIDLSVSGGSPPYSFQWVTGDTTNSISGLNAGTYMVVVADNQGCSDSLSITVNSLGGLTTSFVVTDASCLNGGAIDLIVSGGTPPYTYNWSNGATTQDLNGIPPGLYIVNITDANGCTGYECPIVSGGIPLQVNSTVTDASCNGGDGIIDLSVSGGTPPYNFQWVTGDTTNSLSGLNAGTYMVVVADSQGCSDSLSITVNSLGGLTTSFVVTDASCLNGGAIDLIVSGGTPPYTYNWSNGATTQDLNGIPPGLYIVNITDANGCTGYECPIVSGSPSLQVIGNATQETCAGANDGTAEVIVSGGSSPYTFNWLHGASTSVLNGLSPGSYTAVVTDAFGCTDSITLEVLPGAPLLGSLSTTSPTCQGECDGWATATVTSGTPPYTYQWSNGEVSSMVDNLCPGIFHVSITDANGCSTILYGEIIDADPIFTAIVVTNESCSGSCDGAINLSVLGGVAPYTYQWSNGEATEDINNVCGGSYEVIVTDANGCQAAACAYVESNYLDITVTKTNPLCNFICNGSATVTINNSTGPVTYQWSNGATNSSITNLCIGTYTVSVTNANGCVAVSSVILEPGYMIPLTTRDRGRFGKVRRVEVLPQGGEGPFEYSWSNGTKDSVLDNAQIGEYQVEVKDANGCQASKTILIGELQCGKHEQCPNVCEFAIGPNPTFGEVSVKLNFKEKETFTIEITTIDGKLVKQVNQQDSETWNSNIDISSMPKGIYMLKVSTSEGEIVEKIILQ